ncbi:lysylphosphatidylglycerol synthase transmembrane domain-containing protein [Chloroflexota bacterium]
MRSSLPKLNSHYVAIGKWIILGGMLYLAVKLVNLNEVIATFAQISPLTLVSFLILVLLSKFFYAFRWYLICTNGLSLHNVSNLFLLRINLLGEFVGIAMPSALGGEAVRALKLNARTGRVGQTAASIVADRLMGLVSLGLVVLVLLPKLGASLVWPISLSSGNLLGGIVLSVAGFATTLFWLQRRTKRIRLPHTIQQLKLGFSSLTILVLLSIGGHLVFASGYYLLFQEIQPFPILTITALILTAQLAHIIPISMLGIGLSEGSTIALANLIGMSPETALAVVVIGLGARYLFAISGLLIELVYDGKAILETKAKRTGITPESLQ